MNSTRLDTWTCCPASRACSPGKSPCLSSLGMNRALRDKTRRGTRGTKGWVTGVQNRASATIGGLFPPCWLLVAFCCVFTLSCVCLWYFFCPSLFSPTHLHCGSKCVYVCVSSAYLCAHVCECVHVWASEYTHVHACVHICVQTCAYDVWVYARAPCAVLCIACVCW